MSSDYDISDDDGDYYDDEDMLDGTQEDESGQSEDDMDLDSYGDDFNVTTGGKRKAYEIEYESLSQPAVEKLMQADIDHICGILGVDANVAALLLRHMRWNKEQLIEKYMDNPSGVLCAAGITIPEPPSASTPVRSHSTNATPTRRSTRSSSSKILSFVSPGKSPTITSHTPKAIRTPLPPTDTDTPFVCPICFDDSPDLHPSSLDCGHLFCSNCWTQYVTSKVTDEAEHSIQCMAEGCGLIAPDTFIHDVLFTKTGDTTPAEEEVHKRTWSRFQELLVRNFVGSNNHLKYCPYPGCTNTVSCPSASSKTSLTTIVPTVSCGARGVISDPSTASTAAPSATPAKPPQKATLTKTPSKSKLVFGRKNSLEGSSPLAGREHLFCFGCPIESDHRPVVCSVAKMWLKKCQDDSETANWIKSNTKECSKCQSTIEKNGGCNHMTCKKCKHEFCWVCMGPWSEHGTQWYSCNRYDDEKGVDARDAQSRSRASLERYLHYYNRWANHEQSAKLSLDLYAKTEKKMEDMQLTSTLTWIEVQFMKKAVEEVLNCRETLKWTYAMAYYLIKSNEKDIFEDNQRDLEKAVEDLSELLEGPIEPENIPALRQKVTDKTVYVKKRNNIVLEDTANGFVDGRWKWNISVDGFEEPEDGARID